jgi:hypothetical protein
MDEKLLADKIKHLYGDEFDVEQLKKAQEIAKKIMERDEIDWYDESLIDPKQNK